MMDDFLIDFLMVYILLNDDNVDTISYQLNIVDILKIIYHQKIFDEVQKEIMMYYIDNNLFVYFVEYLINILLHKNLNMKYMHNDDIFQIVNNFFQNFLRD